MSENIIGNLISEYETLCQMASKVFTQICNTKDGYHYRVKHCRYGHSWEVTFNNYYTAKKDALECDCADDAGCATLFTNNPDILNDKEFDWGDVEVRFEE